MQRHTVTHSPIRFFLPFAILVLAALVILHLAALFAVAWFLLIIFAASRLWPWYTARNLTVDRCAPHQISFGDTVTVDLSLGNAGRLRIPWIEVDESVPAGLAADRLPSLATSLPARGRCTSSYSVRGVRRGVHRLGPVTLRLGDLFGLHERVARIESAREIVVFPQILPLGELGVPARSDLATLPLQGSIHDDPAQLIGTRGYRAGDSMRRIHWPASSRGVGLAVKQFRAVSNRQIMLCLDLDHASYLFHPHESVEQAISVAASLAHHYLGQGEVPVGLALPSPRRSSECSVSMQPSRRRSQLLCMLDALARAEHGRTGHFARLMQVESSRLGLGVTVIAITGSPSAGVMGAAAALQRRGLQVLIVGVQPAEGGDIVAGDVRVQRVWADGLFEA